MTRETPEQARAMQLLAQAHAIIAGDTPAYDVRPYYEWSDWRDAAQLAVDGEFSDMVFMQRKQRLFDLWCGISEREQTYWHDDFEEWADRVGEQWLRNMERVAA